jgi:large subunit ribosomal protein L17
VRHGDKVKKLGRTKSHRAALMRNLVAALFTYERIRTTLPKAKEARRFADRMIRFGRENTVAARRQVARFVSDKSLVKKLFDVIAPRFGDRPGGWTRIHRLGPREGDGAEMAVLELVVREERHKEKQAKAAAAKEKGGRKPKSEKPEKKPAEGKESGRGEKEK